MRHLAALPLLLSLLLILPISALSPGAMLQNYNVPNSLIANLTEINATYGSSSYALLYKGNSPYFVINTTHGVNEFVTDPSAISAIISDTQAGISTRSINFTYLSGQMTAYISSAATVMNACLQFTGLDHLTCTKQNLCLSCQSVPACKDYYLGTGALGGVGSVSIMQFGSAYANLTRNLTIYYQSSTNVTALDLISKTASLNAAFSNVSTITSHIYQNPIFPPPPGVDYSQCPGTPLQGPWWCWSANASGICGVFNAHTGLGEYSPIYNHTFLNNVNASLKSINPNLPTQQNLLAMAQAVINNQNAYIEPVVQKAKKAELDALLNGSLSSYPSLKNGSTILLTHIYNTSLEYSLLALESAYNNLTSDYLTSNIQANGAVVAAQLQNTTLLYNAISSEYSSLLSKASNNTLLLIEAQISGAKGNEIAALSLNEMKLNNEVLGLVGNSTAAAALLNTIYSRARTVVPLSIGAGNVVRAIDGPFATSLALAMGLSYDSGIALSPLLSSLLSLVIGAVILLLVYGYYLTLKHNRKVILNRRTARVWKLLFSAASVLLLIYILLTYLLATSAGHAPAGSFFSAIHGARSIAVVLNGSSISRSTVKCGDLIISQARSIGKNAALMYVNGTSCTMNDTTTSKSSCLNSYVRDGDPIVVLTQSNQSSISIYSLYGTALHANGNQSFMDACYASLFIK